MADNKSLPPVPVSTEAETPPLKGWFSYNGWDSNVMPKPGKYTVLRVRPSWLAKEDEQFADLVAAYWVRGVDAGKWENVSAKSSALLRSSFTDSFHLYIRKVDDRLVADVKISLSPSAQALLAVKGKVKYDRFDRVPSEEGEDTVWGVVYLRISDPSDHDELRRVKRNTMRLGSWALNRLGPRVADWAEENL